MTSQIDASLQDFWGSVHQRANWTAAKTEIEQLQGQTSSGPFLPLAGGTVTGEVILEAAQTTLAADVATIYGNGQVYVQGTLDTWVFGSDATGSADSATVGIGSGNADAGSSEYCLVYTGNVTSGPASGPVQLQSGDIAGGTGRSGNIELLTGKSPGGTSGNIVLTPNQAAVIKGNIIVTVPTADPHIAGALWSDPAAGFTLKVSQGAT